MAKRNTVIVIDDHPVVLKGLRDLFGSSQDFRLVGEALSGEDGIDLARRRQPDLIVLDLRVSDALAPDLCEHLRLVSPRAKVVIFTAFDDRGPIQASLRAGACGVLLKDLHETDLLQSLRDVLLGQVVIDERVGGHELTRAHRINIAGNGAYGALTPREYDVLRLLAQGMTSKEIADRLCLTTNTVRSYTQTLIMKLQSRTRIQALATARKLRLI